MQGAPCADHIGGSAILSPELAEMEAAVIFAGYPQTKCQHDQKASAQELIAIRYCAICMVHMAADEGCDMPCFPHWHGQFERHMADQNRQSSLISMNQLLYQLLYQHARWLYQLLLCCLL